MKGPEWLSITVFAAFLAFLAVPERRTSNWYTVNQLGVESMTGFYVSLHRESIEEQRKVLDEARSRGGIRVKEVVVRFGGGVEVEMTFDEFERRLKGECR